MRAVTRVEASGGAFDVNKVGMQLLSKPLFDIQESMTWRACPEGRISPGILPCKGGTVARGAGFRPCLHAMPGGQP